jgi:signal transduction histidine kinase
MPSPFRSLALVIAIPFGLIAFGAAGLLCWGLIREQNRADRVALERIAESNARFLREIPMSVSPSLAGRLGRVLGMEIRSTPPAGAAGVAADGQARRLADGRALVGVEVRTGESLWFVQSPGSSAAALGTPLARASLAGLALLSVALVWVLARKVVGPLQSMAAALRGPGVEFSVPAGVEDRSDEIGVLARALRDAGERIRAERAGRERAERLALLGRMSAAMAHEVNNPLASIRLHAELAASGTADPAAVRESLGWIRTGTERIEGLVNQWMFLANPAPPRIESLEVARLVARVVDFHAPLAREREVRVETDLPDRLPRVRGEERRLEQAFANVLLNAIQATPAGGSVRVAGSSESVRVRVIFEDSGPGFTDEGLRRWAEPFWCGRAAGTGIGLSVVSEVVIACGGSVGVENLVPGPGARVTIELCHETRADT